ncbi:pirin family protein [Rhodoferax sp. WC2427]|uniref:pirin family protein n=1 Tax=Rhodoferax sp. WC2427 TaxID=3234144 RepID=UPI003467583F
MTSSILKIGPLGSPWETIDPFLVCVHHIDSYPQGNAEWGPAASLAGHTLGRDMQGQDGWRMYFGRTVPGFPAHPHRGFETITILREGVVDHSDSTGASARFGAGDVQWLTAGRGIVHAEMFPLLNQDGPNPLELFQIWLNLPARSKVVEPNFKMFWAEEIPVYRASDADGHTEVLCIVGKPCDLDSGAPPAPPPNSWAADPSADVALWNITLSPGARWTLPPAPGSGTRRQLIFFKGATLTIDGQTVGQPSAMEICCTEPVAVVNGAESSEILMLQGRPMAEPVVQDGPFVMNSADEIRQAYLDYRQTGFGDWGWPSNAPVHGPGRRRFASR